MLPSRAEIKEEKGPEYAIVTDFACIPFKNQCDLLAKLFREKGLRTFYFDIRERYIAFRHYWDKLIFAGPI